MTHAYPVPLMFWRSNLPETIREILPSADGATLYIGIGNSQRGDDRAGLYICELIEAKDRIAVLHAGEYPEEAYDEALKIKPVKAVFMDAADMGLPAGTMQILYEDTISERTMTSHKMPVPLISRLIREETGADVVILGIQPACVDFDSPMSGSVRESCETAARMINSSGVEA